MALGKLAFMKNLVSDISPSSSEALAEAKFASELVLRISKHAPKGARVLLMGSVAKGTFLRGSNDVDIFLVLPHSVPRQDFERIVRACAAKAFPTAKKEVAYAEHPYIRIWVNGRKIDLVPAYDIRNISQMASSVDRSILHLKYVLKNLAKAKIPDVLLLKKFLKSNGLYGAEIRVEGFSGYLCELLVIHYGSFMQVVKAASRWSRPVFVDPGQRFKGGKNLVTERFGDVPFMVIDPVDPNRNVAAIISDANLKWFISLAKKFVRNPSAGFFKNSEADFQKAEFKRFMRSKGAKACLSFRRPKLVDDILWGQLKRFSRVVQDSLENMGFAVAGAHIASDSKQCGVFFRVTNPQLQQLMLIPGPPLEMKEHAKRFRQSHPRAKFSKKGGRLVARIGRKIRTLDKALGLILEKRHGFPSHIPGNLRLSFPESQ